MTPRPMSQDPMIQQLIAQAKGANFGRRQVLTGATLGLGALALAACSTGGSSAPKAAADSARLKARRFSILVSPESDAFTKRSP